MTFTLVPRQNELGLSRAMVTLLLVFLILVLLVLLLVGVLVFLRHRRRARKAVSLPTFNDKRVSTAPNHRRVAVRPTQSIHIYHDKEISVDESSRPSSPTSPLPEIRITFPEEFDTSGKRQSGRVVVVHVGETGNVGLEPLDEKLPAYHEGERFQSLDLERIGGLDEKKSRPQLGWE